MTLRERTRAIRDELRALAVALGDPRTPTHAKVIAGLTLGFPASPIDPIPDFVPVLGYVDDAVFVPAGLSLARRTIPDDVLAEARSDEGRDQASSSRRLLGAVIVVLLWAVRVSATGWAVAHLLGLLCRGPPHTYEDMRIYSHIDVHI